MASCQIPPTPISPITTASTDMAPPPTPVMPQQIPRPFPSSIPTVHVPHVPQVPPMPRPESRTSVPSEPEKDKAPLFNLLKGFKIRFLKVYQHPYTWIALKATVLLLLAIKLAQETEFLNPLKEYIPFGQYDWEAFREYWGIDE